MEKVKNIVVGAGLSGAVVARQVAEQTGEPVRVLESRPHVAGMAYDYRHSSGITVQKYGPHIFHTNQAALWQYVSRFTRWHAFSFRPRVCIDGTEVPLPINLNSIAQLFPTPHAHALQQALLQAYGEGAKVPVLALTQHASPALRRLGQYVYEKVYRRYTQKQWGPYAAQLDGEILERVPVHISWQDGYFQDTYQAIPADGYTRLVENILQHPQITVQLNTCFEPAQWSWERLFYTGPIDAFFGYRFGRLPYRSLRFDVQEKQTEYAQSAPVINYPNEPGVTRICEHKYFLDEKAPSTVISVEYPQAFEPGKNEPYYPVHTASSAALLAAYRAEAEKRPDVYFLGRLGGFYYCSMEQAIAAALQLCERLVG